MRIHADLKKSVAAKLHALSAPAFYDVARAFGTDSGSALQVTYVIDDNGTIAMKKGDYPAANRVVFKWLGGMLYEPQLDLATLLVCSIVAKNEAVGIKTKGGDVAAQKKAGSK